MAMTLHKCPKCSKGVRTGPQCKVCTIRTHYKCLGLKKEDFSSELKFDEWLCKECKSERSLDMVVQPELDSIVCLPGVNKTEVKQVPSEAYPRLGKTMLTGISKNKARKKKFHPMRITKRKTRKDNELMRLELEDLTTRVKKMESIAWDGPSDTVLSAKFDQADRLGRIRKMEIEWMYTEMLREMDELREINMSMRKKFEEIRRVLMEKDNDDEKKLNRLEDMIQVGILMAQGKNTDESKPPQPEQHNHPLRNHTTTLIPTSQPASKQNITSASSTYNLLLIGDSHIRNCRQIIQDESSSVSSKKKIACRSVVLPNATAQNVAESIRPSLLSSDWPSPTAVIIGSGTNNIKTNFDNADKKSLITSLRQSISECKRYSPSSQIILMNIPYRYDSPHLNETIFNINKSIDNITKEFPRVKIVNVSDIPRANYTKHGLHMNKTGKVLLCNKIIRKVADTSYNRKNQNHNIIRPILPLLDLNVTIHKQSHPHPQCYINQFSTKNHNSNKEDTTPKYPNQSRSSSRETNNNRSSFPIKSNLPVTHRSYQNQLTPISTHTSHQLGVNNNNPSRIHHYQNQNLGPVPVPPNTHNNSGHIYTDNLISQNKYSGIISNDVYHAQKDSHSFHFLGHPPIPNLQHQRGLVTYV